MREGGAAVTEKFTKESHVPFTADFHLHPNSFVLGITLELIRLKKDLADVVTGKSLWGRRGLIIATATGVHCGFTGCLTLKITNLGQIPILLKPGMPICQLFLHRVEPNSLPDGRGLVDASQYNGRRKPILGEIKGEIKMDAFSRALSVSEASPSPPPSATPL
jgi:dCTP deaminase